MVFDWWRDVRLGLDNQEFKKLRIWENGILLLVQCIFNFESYCCIIYAGPRHDTDWMSSFMITQIIWCIKGTAQVSIFNAQWSVWFWIINPDPDWSFVFLSSDWLQHFLSSELDHRINEWQFKGYIFKDRSASIHSGC